MTIDARDARDAHARDLPAAGQAVRPIRFVCPRCRTGLVPAPAAFLCRGCDVSYPVVGGIPTFIEDERYWGEIREEDMAWLVAHVEGGHPWREAILGSERASIRNKTPFLLDFRRANWVIDLALPESADVLDVGAGLGGVAAGLAPYAGRVVALEPVFLRARFAAARFAQDGLHHVEVVRGTGLDHPFPPASFDLVVLNGVLEWLGKGSRDPGATQRAVLKRLVEALRPDGTLAVAIENRIGIWFFLGRQDHSYLPFTSLMPRWLASGVTRARRGHPYDTYTYTHGGYRRLFAQCGLSEVRTLLPIWSYNTPDYLVPLEAGPRADMLAFLMTAGGRQAPWPWLRRQHCALRLSRPFANDFIFFARRRPEVDHGWLDRMVRERWASWGLAGSPDRLSFLIHNRSHPTIVVYGPGRQGGRVVVRLSTDPQSPGSPPHFSPPRAEIEALRWLAPRLLGAPALVPSVPRALDLLDHGVHEFGVTTYMPGTGPLLPAPGARSAEVERGVGALIATALGWLEAFHRCVAPGGGEDAKARPLAGADLAEEILPGLARALPDGAELAARVEAELAALGSLGHVTRPPQHGDFVLSNLRLDRERLSIIDWERFGRVPMPGFDAIHFVTYVAMLLQPSPWHGQLDVPAVVRLISDPGRLGKALRAPLDHYLAQQGLDPELLPVLFLAYLAAFIGEYGGDPARRGIVGTKADLLRAALAERSGRGRP